jgi:hypothetical protein
LIEGEFLWVSKSRRNDFQFTTIQVAAKCRATIGHGQRLAFESHVESAITNRKVEFSIGPKTQAVQVMAEKRPPHPVASVQSSALVGLAITRRVTESPEMRYARVVNIVAAGEYARTDAVQNVVEAIGKDAGRFIPTIAVLVRENAKAIVVVGEPLGTIGKVGADVTGTIFNGAGLKVVIEPLRETLIVENGRLHAVRLANKYAAASVEAKRNGIGNFGLSRRYLDLKSIRNMERSNLLFCFIRSCRESWLVRFGAEGTGKGQVTDNGRHSPQRRMSLGTHGQDPTGGRKQAGRILN